MEKDTTRYLELEIEDEVNVINTGKADVGEGTLTIVQGGVTKGTFNANAKTDTTITLNKYEIPEGGEIANYLGCGSDGEPMWLEASSEIAGSNRQPASCAGVAIKLEEYAPLDSPALTGTPTAPTATAGTNTTQIATTAFVTDAIETAITEVENGYY